MDEDNFLELLGLFMDMTEKQDEIMHRLGRIAARMAADILLMQNDQEHPDIPRTDTGADKLGQDISIVKEVIDQYNKIKAGLEP